MELRGFSIAQQYDAHRVGVSVCNAEYVAKVRRILDNHEVALQTAELGKIDLRGGGTISYIRSDTSSWSF